MSDAWPTFFKSFNRLHKSMEEEMKKAGEPSLEIYDVLWTLEQAPDHSLRFHELGEKIFLSRSNMTRLAQRLEKDGLIECNRCPSDRRGVWAVLTDKGLKLRKKMWQTYKKLIEDNFSSQLSQNEHESLIKILKKFHKIDD